MAKKSTKKVGDENLDNLDNSVESNDGSPAKEKPVLSKKFGKLSEYKAKINFKDVKYKPQEWINMSPAFKEK